MRGQPNTMKLNTAIEYGAASLLILVTLLCIFTPEPIFFKQFAAYTLYIMLGLLGAGLLFFVFNLKKYDLYVTIINENYNLKKRSQE